MVNDIRRQKFYNIDATFKLDGVSNLPSPLFFEVFF